MAEQPERVPRNCHDPLRRVSSSVLAPIGTPPRSGNGTAGSRRDAMGCDVAAPVCPCVRGSKEGLSRAEMAERRLTFLFESYLDDLNAMGSHHKPMHIKLDEFDLRRIQPDG